MQSRGLETSPRALIQQLRANLTDRYRRHAILKELLQNADDAGARTVSLGWSSGMPQADHPLLRGPALFALNDGSFDARDAEAICHFGLNHKAGDSSSIGKFGLGLKSVFHLCEAFFYFSNREDAVGGSRTWWDVLGFTRGRIAFNGFVNPWSGTGLHEDWGRVPASLRDCMIEHLGGLVPAEGEWFCLWVPLRRQEHCAGVHPIYQDFPGDDVDQLFEPGPAATRGSDNADRGASGGQYLFPHAFPEEAAVTLPMLRHVRRIGFWPNWRRRPPGDDREKRRPLWCIELNGDARRTAFAEENFTRGELSGTVVLQRPEGSSQIVYAGFENAVAGLTSLREHDFWPRAFSLSSTGESLREKARPHAAAYFAVRIGDTAEGSLSIDHAVFLPLSQEQNSERSRSALPYALRLHGAFFIDAGRGRLEAFSRAAGLPLQTEQQVRSEWNRRLATGGTYRLVLPALDLLARRLAAAALGDVSIDDEVSALTAALHTSGFFREHREHVCGEWQWVWRWQPDGGQWCLVPSATPVYSIPAADAPGLPEEVLPALRAVAAREVVTVHGRPRLAAQDPVSSWPEPLTVEVLDRAGPTRADHARTAYLDAFLGHLGETCQAEAVQARIADLIRRLLSTHSTPSLRGLGPTLQRLIGRLHRERRVALPLPASLADELKQRICGLQLSAVLVPEEFEPGGERGSGRLDFAETCDLLRTLDRQPAGWSVARRVLEICSAPRADVLRDCENLVLWRAVRVMRDGASPKLVPFALLAGRRDGGLLFRGQPQDAARAFRSALAEADLWLIAEEDAAMLFGDAVPLCDQRGIARGLLRRPVLAGPPDRIPLLRLLLTAPQLRGQAEWRRASRYLLHGNQAAFEDESPLLLQEAGLGEDIWSRLVRWALARSGEKWRLIPADVGGALAPDDWVALNIQRISAASALATLAPHADAFDGGEWGVPDRESLLRSEAGADLLRRLRIHEGRTGGLHRIEDRTYWDGGIDLPPGLADRVTLLRRRPDLLTPQQEGRLTAVFAPHHAIELALAEPEPQRYWRFILDLLRPLLAGGQAGRLRGALRDVPWLPGAGHDAFAPAEILHLPGLETTIDRLIRLHEGAEVGVCRLAEEVRQHPRFDDLASSLFPGRRDVLRRLGDLAGREARHHIGCLPGLNAETLETWLDAVADDQEDLFPLRRDIRSVVDVAGADACVEGLLPPLRMTVERPRLLAILKFLSAGGRSAATAHTVHNWYLGELVEATRHAASPDDLLTALRDPQLKLRNRLNKWRSPDQLCAARRDMAQVSPVWLLHPDHWDVLSRHPIFASEFAPGVGGGHHPGPSAAASPTIPIEARIRDSVGVLERYFTPWEDYLPREAIGGMFALCGDFPELADLAQRKLGRNYSLSQVREDLWIPVKDGESVHEVMCRQRLVVEVVPEEAGLIRERNLFGDMISVPLADDYEHLFIHCSRTKWFDFQGIDGCRINRIRLRAVDVHAIARAQGGLPKLQTLLRNSARLFLNEIWFENEAAPGLPRLFEDLDQSEAREILLAQQLVVEQAFSNLDMARGRLPAPLRSLVRRWDDARRRKTEQALVLERKGRIVEEPADAQMNRVFNELRDLLDRDPDTQAVVLQLVRGKIEQNFRYHDRSVLFELFQNADDAWVERGPCQSAEPAWFAVHRSAEGCVCLHGGRPINEPPPGADAVDGRTYDRDLEKMVCFHASDKVEANEDGRLTGQFGLGFKSLHLVTDRPRVLSGRRAFDIVGGLYPRRLRPEDVADLAEHLAGVGRGEETQGTAIGFRTCLPGQAEHIVAPFRDVLPYLLVFARRIRRMLWSEDGSRPGWCAWEERLLPNTRTAFTGSLSAGHGPGAARTEVLGLRLPQGTLLFRLEGEGLGRFPDRLPTLWVTAPTAECAGLGFLINAAFALDTGRARLASSSAENGQLAARLGKDLAESLCELFRAAPAWGQWESGPAALRSRADPSRHRLWQSLWALLSAEPLQRLPHPSGGPAVALVHRILWDSPTAGAAAFYRACPALPSGLEVVSYRALVRVTDILARVGGVLDACPEDLACAAGWPEFARRNLAGRLVSESRVWLPLRRLCPGVLPEGTESIRLRDLLERELGREPHATPDAAARLGQLIDRPYLDRLPQPEQDEVRGFLGPTRFLARDGDIHPAAQLLLAAGLQDPQRDEEFRRARFAPDGRVLSPEYRGPALRFFLACRGPMRAGVQEMAGWVRHADTHARRRAAIEYLCHGEMGQELADLLRREGLGDTWIDVQTALELAGSEIDRWLLRIRFGWLPQGTDATETSQQPPRKTDDLERLHSWWSRHGPKCVREYEGWIYPSGVPATLLPQPPCQDQEQRRAWVALFLLGILHTMGRTQLWQHKEFLRRCDHDWGWLDVFIQGADAPTEQEWVRIIDGYFERQQDERHEYYQWLRGSFVGMRLIAGRLDDFVELFLAADRMHGAFDLTAVTSPRTSPHHQRGGVDAPAVTRVLGIGACFVMRELVRRGVLKNEAVFRHCYVPAASVREELKAFGYQDGQGEEAWRESAAIARFLTSRLGPERATFGRDFDLPFLFVSRYPGLWDQIRDEAVKR